MVACRASRWVAGVLGLAFGGAALAQTAEVEAELKLRLLQLRLQQLQDARQPQPKQTAAPGPAPKTATTDAVVAQLGDSRLRHAAPPTCVQFSPDGKRVYSGGEDGMLRVWDAATGEPVTALNFASVTITAIRFTPDGGQLAVQSDDGQLRFLDAASLKPGATLTNVLAPGFSFSPDGSLIAAVGADGQLEVTELGSGLVKLELPPGKPAEFLPDGKLVAVGDPKGKVTLHMLAGGKPVMTVDHGAKLTSFAIRPDGKQVATGGPDGPGGTVKVWDIADPKNPKVVAEFDGANRPRGWVGKDRLAAGDGSAAGVYDLAAKKWVGRVNGVDGEWAVTADGSRIAATGPGRLRVRMWDVASGKQLHAENDTFPDSALLAPAADGRSIFLLAGDAAFRWPVAKPAATAAGSLPGKAVAAAAGGGRLAVATRAEVLVYDGFDPVKPLPAKPSRTLTEHATECRAVAVSADGKKVAYTGGTAKTVIADAATGKTIRVLPIETMGLALAFTPDGEKVAMIGRDGYLGLWSAKTVGDGYGGHLWRIRVQRGQKGAVAISSDGQLIAASSSGLVKVVNADGKQVFEVGNLFEHGNLTQAVFSPDGRFLITATEGTSGAVQVWEVATHTLVARLSTGFGTVHRIGLFADGTRLASAGAEEVVTLWDLTGRRGKGAPGTEELLAALGDLGAPEGARGVPAVRTLVAGGAKSLPVVTAGLDEYRETQQGIAKWVKDLGAADAADREVAAKELTALGARALPALDEAVAGTASPEVKKRAGEVIDKLAARGVRLPTDGLSGDALRLYRAVEVLEKVGGADAKALLKRIEDAGGPAGREAAATLKRLGKG